MHRSSVRFALAAAFYGLLTVALTWPLVLHPATLVPSDLGDSLLNMWIMSWNARAVPLTEQWWNAPQFFPVSGALGFSEHLLGLAPLTTPIILATGDLLLAYNVVFLLAFPLTALATHYLAYTLTRRHDLSCVAAIAFAFAPYRMPQIAHVQVLASWWMPLALAGLHRYFEEEARRVRWLVLFAGAWLFQALTCGYYLFYLSVLILLWVAWFGLFRGRTRVVINVLAAWTIAVIALAPVLYGYWKITRLYNLRRELIEIRSFSADLASLLTASDLNRAWHWLRVVPRPEADLFPGLAIVLLVIAGVTIAWRLAAREGQGHARASRILAIIAVVPLLMGLTRLFYGPFRLGAGGFRFLSVRTVENPVATALVLLLAAAALHPAVRTAWRRRSALAFYLLGAVTMWLFALGPSPTLLNAPAFSHAPYELLLLLPGMDGVRVPARFWMLAALCLAIAAALSLRLVMQRWPRAARALPPIVIAALLIDAWPYAMPMAARPAERPNHSEAELRLDLPLGDYQDILSVFRSASHRRPLFNGYSGYFAPHYPALIRLLAQRDPGIVPRLAEFGSIEVTVDHSLDTARTWRAFLDRAPDVRRVYEGEAYTSYFVPKRVATAWPEMRPSPPVAASASINGDMWRTVADGDLDTRWHAEREQRRGDWFMADLGSFRTVSGVEMQLGRYVGDSPLELVVETSLDGEVWSPGFSGTTGILLFDGLLRDPRGVPLTVRMDPREARYVRLTQMGLEMVHDWSIAELRILTPR